MKKLKKKEKNHGIWGKYKTICKYKASWKGLLGQ